MDKYFIVKRNCGFVGNIYVAFHRASQEKVEEYMRKHSPNCELVFASPYQEDYIEELEMLRKEGINVY